MRTILSVTAAACLLTAAAANAQDHPTTQPAPKPGAAEHVERAGSELKAAGKVAGADARDALHEAGEHASETMREARAKAASFFEGAREHVRRALLNAADGLESDQRTDDREKARTQRQELARVEQWRALREQLDATGTDSVGQQQPVTPALSAELRIHAQRTARLARIRALADKAKDGASVKRCDALVSQELTRHEQQMKALLEKPQQVHLDHAHTGKAPKASQP